MAVHINDGQEKVVRPGKFAVAKRNCCSALFVELCTERLLCALQASSAASKRAFSKAGLIVSAKRVVLQPNRVDHLSLVAWASAAVASTKAE